MPSGAHCTSHLPSSTFHNKQFSPFLSRREHIGNPSNEHRSSAHGTPKYFFFSCRVTFAWQGTSIAFTNKSYSSQRDSWWWWFRPKMLPVRLHLLPGVWRSGQFRIRNLVASQHNRESCGSSPLVSLVVGSMGRSTSSGSNHVSASCVCR